MFRKNKKQEEVKQREPSLRLEFREEYTDGVVNRQWYFLIKDVPLSTCFSTRDFLHMSPREYQELVELIKKREGLVEPITKEE